MSSAPSPLVSARWLADHLQENSTRTVDASWGIPGAGSVHGPGVEGCIPGAVFFDIDGIADPCSPLPRMLPAPDFFRKAVEKAGMNSDDRIIVYDSHGIFSAARVWWTFRAMGHNRVFVLDGGLPAWKRSGYPVEDRFRPPSATGRFTATLQRHLVADDSDIRHAIRTKSATVIDSRTPGRFLGASPEPPGMRAGHIPGSVNIPWHDLVTSGGDLADTARLEEILTGNGIHPPAPAITTCGSGVTACITALALSVLGNHHVPVFDGSWAQWGARQNDPALFPVKQGWPG